MTVPLHVSISEKLRQQIDEGEYLPGEKLPSEHQLMESFNVSRITVRQAIANLISQGLVQAQQGKGVFVTPQQKVSYSLTSTLDFLEKDLARKGVSLSIETLTLEQIRPPAEVSSILQLTKREKVLFQEKLLRMDGVAGAMDLTYLVSRLGETLSAQLATQMTFPLLEAHGIHIEKIEAVIECTHADYHKSSYLDVPLGHPLIVYRYTTYTDQGPILHGETISRADRFCYSLTVQADVV
ncbi:MAG: GntR family transcriptional regulator [Cyanobacteria bacterium P01_F01_bin.4]